jgi:hypothetical protein
LCVIHVFVAAFFSGRANCPVRAPSQLKVKSRPGQFNIGWNPAAIEQRTGRTDRIGSKASRERTELAWKDHSTSH